MLLLHFSTIAFVFFGNHFSSQLEPGAQQPSDLEAENARLKKRVRLLETQLNKTRPVQHHASNISTALTRSRLQALGSSIILTFTNKARVDFANTWTAHVRRLGLSNWLIGATDANALSALIALGIPCFDMHTKLPEAEWAWGSGTFHSLGPAKVQLIYQALLWGIEELVITDVDALVLKDPFPYMGRWPDAGFLTTSDHLGNTTAADGLEMHAAIHSAFNIGYMFFRKSALPLVKEWREVPQRRPDSPSP